MVKPRSCESCHLVEEKQRIDSFVKTFSNEVQSDAAQSAFEDLQKACDLAIEMAQTSKIHTSHVLLIKATRNYHKGSADNDETAVSNNLSLIQHHAEFFRANSLGLSELDLFKPVWEQAKKCLTAKAADS